MARMTESCSVCGSTFEVQFRYQMEERDGGFSFFCSNKCLEASHSSGSDGLVTCDACKKNFSVQLVSQVLYIRGRRVYVCSTDCRGMILKEARGARLGDHVSDRSEPESTEQDFASPLSFVPRVEPESGNEPEKSPSGASIFAVFNHKGGTGKTTTSVSIAAGLAMAGHRVLLVDTDAQGNVGVSLHKTAEKSLYHVLVMGVPLKAVVQSVRENLDLIPSNETLAAAELYLAGRQNRDRVLRDKLASAVRCYDYIVLDCSPSLSLLNQNALVFADNVLVPVACDYLSLVGVRQVIKTVRNVNQLLHHQVRLWGVLPTFYDSRANICRDAVETLQKHFAHRCLAPIRSVIKVKEAPAHGQTIFEYAGASTAADDYRAVVEKIIAERGSGRGTHGSEDVEPLATAVSA